MGFLLRCFQQLSALHLTTQPWAFLLDWCFFFNYEFVVNGEKTTFLNKSVPPVYNEGTSLGQKWWWTVLKIKISCSQWEGSACTQSALFFFLSTFGWEGEDFFHFSLCFQHVPFKFPMCSPRVFRISPHFNPICFCPKSSLSHLYR